MNYTHINGNSSINISDQVEVFYHLACMGNWRIVFYEQMSLLNQTDFKRVNLIVLGTKRHLKFINSICDGLKINVKIVFQSPDLSNFEKPSMLAIEKYTKENRGYILYLHTKGVSHATDETKVKWRQLMMRELVQNWKHCVNQLPYYDIIGVNWQYHTPTPHFSGNFWYASVEYIRKLEDFKHYYDNPRFLILDDIYNRRLGCEFWIGSGKEAPKVLSLFCENTDFCDSRYWADKKYPLPHQHKTGY